MFDLMLIFSIVFVLALTIFVLKMFSSESAVKMKRVALWIVSNLIFLFPAGYIWFFVYIKYLSEIYDENYIAGGILAGVILSLFQVVIFAVERYSKGSYEKKVGDVSLISLTLTMFLMFLFYREAYFDFQLMSYVENGITWVLFCIIIYILARIVSSEKTKKMFLWNKILIVAGPIMAFVGYSLFFVAPTHSEPHLDTKEFFICTNKFGKHEQYGPWFKKSWKGVCIQHRLCATNAGKVLGCDSELASLIKNTGDSWQRTNADFLDIVPYSYKEDHFVENPKALEERHVVSDAYLFRTNKGGGFYYTKGGEWIVGGIDASSFQSLGGFYFRDEKNLFYQDKKLRVGYNIYNIDDIEYLGSNCLRYREIFYKKGKKVDSCD